ncbi:CatA-like O-acetyltransferase [Maribacter sp. PR1]|uniref:CatA-like O-acetyltransferase n=1 Tax=Maribacter cobaltidurans TaxID=1178778 RepID=A0ABU7IR55_9FLAO|nr:MULTISPECIES: CatA-like O-acetyltransferase [Maribacter]MDC6388059.1 CatA-like O-acetyltransferase [Maribacter sp. PR1]MEE1975447.1 CatA-like O-acetyltransferase [Maribacter cobaltidurans]
MKKIDLATWKRKEHFDFFSKMKSPTFGIVTEVNCEQCYKNSKEKEESFFANYLHKSMIAVNAVDELKYRITNGEVIAFGKIHAGITITREDETFGFGFVNFSSDFETFNIELQREILADYYIQQIMVKKNPYQKSPLENLRFGKEKKCCPFQ